MIELAATAVPTEAFRPVGTALLGLEPFVGDVFTVANQFLGAMCEPTLVTVGAVPLLRVIFTQLSLILSFMNLGSRLIDI